ncbi:hypothetical protein GQ600_18 [Phytophthora cactorum]|nr:hypothetical protein GQ600_18 [Phytophthora cactorum]
MVLGVYAQIRQATRKSCRMWRGGTHAIEIRATYAMLACSSENNDVAMDDKLSMELMAAYRLSTSLLLQWAIRVGVTLETVRGISIDWRRAAPSTRTRARRALSCKMPQPPIRRRPPSLAAPPARGIMTTRFGRDGRP